MEEVGVASTGYSVAGILERYLPEYQQRYYLPLHHERILEKLLTCRTPDAGLHAWQCQDCGHVCANYNSCNNRHCLICGIRQRMQWLEQMESWTLPCHYWHIVFTLPHEFNDLAGINPREIYGLLFFAGRESLLRYLGREFDVLPSVASVLHTWGQAMLPHIHSHNVVSCGGLSGDGQRWIDIDPNDPRLQGETLPQLYRGLFLEGLRKGYEEQRLTIPAGMASIKTLEDFDNWLSVVAEKSWMVNVQPPPAGCDGPATALGYLSRYMAGTCIGDQRILDDDGTNVTIRIKDYREGGALDEMTMTGVEFIRRFVQHILPPGFVRVRYAGLLAPRNRAEYLEHCQDFLKDRIQPTVEEELEPTAEEEDQEEERAEEKVPKCCPRCHSGELIFLQQYWPEDVGTEAEGSEPSQEHSPVGSIGDLREKVPP